MNEQENQDDEDVTISVVDDMDLDCEIESFDANDDALDVLVIDNSTCHGACFESNLDDGASTGGQLNEILESNIGTDTNCNDNEKSFDGSHEVEDLHSVITSHETDKSSLNSEVDHDVSREETDKLGSERERSTPGQGSKSPSMHQSEHSDITRKPFPPNFQTPKNSISKQNLRSDLEVMEASSVANCIPQNYSTPINPLPKHKIDPNRRSSSVLKASDGNNELHNMTSFKNRVIITASTKNDPTTRNLLSNFITYKDQIPPTPNMENVHIRDLTERRQSLNLRPSTAPAQRSIDVAKSRRKPGLEKRKSLSDLPNGKHSDPYRKTLHENDEPQLCIIGGKRPPSPQTPESQIFPFLNSRRSSLGLQRSPSTAKITKNDNQYYVFDNQTSWKRIISAVLFTSVNVSCFLSIVARCVTLTGMRKTLLYYIIESPTVWIVRFYIILFQIVLILVETNVFIPGVIPRGTLDNLVQRGFIQSFIGLLDMCMNSNKTFVENISDGIMATGIESLVKISFAVLSITPKGLIACGILYFLFGICGFSGRRAKISD